MVWQRARSDEQKELRRQSLLDAARRLHARLPLAEISLNGIAREANVSKANVYRYFESREELFLHLTLDAMESWSGTVIHRFASLPSPAPAEVIAEAVTASLLEHPDVGRLSAVLATVLERNVSTETAAAFKLDYAALLVPVLAALHRVLGADVPEAAARDVYRASAILLAGIWPMAYPAPAVAEALARPELVHLQVDFRRHFAGVLAALIRGMREE